MADIATRFFRQIEIDPVTECWEWQGFLFQGYGQFKENHTHLVRAHRWSYAQYVGALVDGLVVDHLCSNRRCCNPDHLEQVTQKENVMRAKLSVTHCPQGHRYVEKDNRGKRQCRSCRNAAARRHYRKVRARG
jgi:hypothetical protein